MYWLELLAESGAVPSAAVAPLLRETNELVAMTVASKKPLKAGIGQLAGFPASASIGNRKSGIVNRNHDF